MNSQMVAIVNPAIILHSDASQFAVGLDFDGKVVVKYINRNNKKTLKAVPDEFLGGITKFS